MLPLQIALTRWNPAEAEITFSLVPDDPSRNVELRGKLHGPHCLFSETIEVAYPIKPLPRSGELVRSQVYLPDPCPWSPAAPFLYTAHYELWVDNERIVQEQRSLGLKDLLLHPRKGLKLNQQPLELRGLAQRSAELDFEPMRKLGVNLVMAPVNEATLPVWTAGDRHGFFVLGEIDPEDEPTIWLAHETLSQHVSALGWVVPHDTIHKPQHWHNIVSLLHGLRPDLYLGLRYEEPAEGQVPGQVSFVVGYDVDVADLAAVHLPQIILRRRGTGWAKDEAKEPVSATVPPEEEKALRSSGEKPVLLGSILRQLPAS